MKALIPVILALAVIGGAGGAANAEVVFGESNSTGYPIGEVTNVSWVTSQQVTPTANHIDWNICHDGACFVYLHPQNQSSYSGALTQDNSNRVMDIFLPDGTCNLGGHIQSNGKCNFPSIILTASDYIRLQNDVAFMAVLNIADTTSNTNADFCPLARAIWDGQTTDYQQKLLDKYNLVVPVDCQTSPPPVVVPEFGAFAAVALVIGLGSILAIATKHSSLRYN